MSLKNVIKESVVIVHKGRYAYLKVKNIQAKNYFMVSKDKDEITVVAKEKDARSIKPEKQEKWFKLLEIKVSKPFYSVGFLAAVTKAIAGKKLNVLVVSTFSKDYILVRENSCSKAVNALKSIGFNVVEE